MIEDMPNRIPASMEERGLRLARPVPIAEQHWAESTVPLVSICCATYNHEAFIRECLDGFLLQETTFPVEILINDDASTDDTATVVREYASKHPHLIKPIFQSENKRSRGIKPNPTFNYPRAKGKYIAFCDGDDYWTDTLKLEKQVAFLEGHPDYVLCWTRFQTLDDKKGGLAADNNGKYFTQGNGAEFDFKIFAEGWHIGMQTLVFRRKEIMENNNFDNPMFKDAFLISDLLDKGKGFCLSDITAVYRIHSGGIYSSTNELARASIGANTYREIFRAHPKNNYLRLKYEKFNNQYIQKLIKYQEYEAALAALNEELQLTTSSEADRNNQFIARVGNLLSEAHKGQERYKNQLEDLKRSFSFKTGRALTLPTRALRKSKHTILYRIASLLPDPSFKNQLDLKRRGVTFINKGKIVKDSKHLAPLSPDSSRKPQLIVSLTSFPPRMEDIFFTLYSLLNQSLKPDRLVLWLAEEQFPARENDLPARVLELRRLGLEIKWCADIKSYKKLVPALVEFPDDIIVTADDDIFYPENWLEKLYASYTREPQHIHCHRAHLVTFDEDDNIADYNEWPKCVASRSPSFKHFCTTGGGVLYPPGCLYKDVINEDLFMKLCQHADDIWFWAMAVLNDKKIRIVDGNISNLTYVDPILEFRLDGRPTLTKINISENTTQLKRVLEYYENELSLYSKISATKEMSVQGELR